MTKPYTKEALSTIFDSDLVWRRKELSDLKQAIRSADEYGRPVLLRALIAMIYAHWEGYAKECATRYFQYLTLRKKPYSDYKRQFYVNSFLIRLEALYQSKLSIRERCSLINSILDGASGRFSYIHEKLIDTRSNLGTDVMRDICEICDVDSSHFESKRFFLDVLILKRRNAIAHGHQEFIHNDEVDGIVSEILALMAHFSTLLENKVYQGDYLSETAA